MWHNYKQGQCDTVWNHWGVIRTTAEVWRFRVEVLSSKFSLRKWNFTPMPLHNETKGLHVSPLKLIKISCEVFVIWNKHRNQLFEITELITKTLITSILSYSTQSIYNPGEKFHQDITKYISTYISKESSSKLIMTSWVTIQKSFKLWT
jgi:hypothetical protein